EYFLQYLGLAAEEIVDGGLRDAQAGGDVLYLGLVVAFPVEQRGGGGQHIERRELLRLASPPGSGVGLGRRRPDRGRGYVGRPAGRRRHATGISAFSSGGETRPSGKSRFRAAARSSIVHGRSCAISVSTGQGASRCTVPP